MGTARRLSRQTRETAHVYGECRYYAARTWPERRRVLIKAEVVRHPGREPRDHPRFVVTNLTSSPRHLYETIYCARRDIENRIKELHHGLEIDRTSCSRFLANQLRGLLTAAAYVLYQELRSAPRAPPTVAPKSAPCVSSSSSSASGCKPRCGASCCICRGPAHGCATGSTSPTRSAPHPRSAVALTPSAADRDCHAPQPAPVVAISPAHRPRGR
jgi:hypothetical protein